jgi:hypothetical protein
MSNSSASKKCRLCGRIFPLEEFFYFKKNGKTHYRCTCHECYSHCRRAEKEGFCKGCGIRFGGLMHAQRSQINPCYCVECQKLNALLTK